MTAFSTLDCASWRSEPRSAWPRAVARVLLAGALALWGLGLARAVELSSLRTERAEDGIYLTANVRFELPPVVEDALLRGIALIFVAEAEIYRERWYWTDKKVAAASRSLRLAYQPLTRRWRISQGSDAGGVGRAALAQTYDTLAEALGVIERVSRWKIAESADVDGSAHALQFRFRLDLSQLPRPFQIGIAGQKEWQIALERKQRLRLDARPEAARLPEAPAGEK